MPESPQTLTILFADIAGSTRLYEQVGDIEAHRRVAASLACMAQAVDANCGEVLRTVGDSTLASFSNCDDALLAASQMHTMHQDLPLVLRAGFHVGPVIPDKGDVYGNAVNLAARVASFARSGEITATGVSVAQLNAQNKARAVRLDAITVKGISEPVAVYRIDWQDDDDQRTRVASHAGAMHAVSSRLSLELQYRAKTLIVDSAAPKLGIGRDESSNTIAVSGDRVSRNHARIEWSATQVLLIDDSTNGTYFQRDGHQALFVRRESVVLDGAGKIGVGSSPEDDPDSILHFRLVY